MSYKFIYFYLLIILMTRSKIESIRNMFIIVIYYKVYIKLVFQCSKYIEIITNVKLIAINS